MQFKDLELGDVFTMPGNDRIYVKSEPWKTTDPWKTQEYEVNTLLFVNGRVEQWDPFFGPIFIFDEQEVSIHNLEIIKE